jgi:hypothetical protein
LLRDCSLQVWLGRTWFLGADAARLALGEIFSLLSIRRNRTVEGFESGGEGQERYRRGAKVFIWRARHRLIVASTLDLAGLSRMDWCSASMCCTPVPGQSYRPSSSGVTQTVFRARKAYLPCTSTNMPVGLWRSAPRGSLSVDESSDVMDGAHPPTDAPSLARGQSGSRVRSRRPISWRCSATQIRTRSLGEARGKPRVLLSSQAIAGGLKLFRVCAEAKNHMARVPIGKMDDDPVRKAPPLWRPAAEWCKK